MPPLPPASWFKTTETSKHTEMYCGRFRKLCNGDRRDEESPFFDCWDWKHEQSVLQQVDPGARNAPKSVPSVKSCFSVNFPVCSVCQKLGVYQHLPSKVPQYDISSEAEGRPDEIPVEVAPSDHSARACCLVPRRSVSMGQNSSGNPESPGSTRYSQEWNRGEMSTNSGCYSVQPAS